jgi:hypothetical protein
VSKNWDFETQAIFFLIFKNPSGVCFLKIIIIIKELGQVSEKLLKSKPGGSLKH